MAQEMEIEFKNLLTAQQYEQLLQEFQIDKQMVHRQTNHYFDTPSQSIRNRQSGLRIRQIDNYYECTLKEKSAEHTHLETTEELTAEQAQKMLAGEGFYAQEIAQKLESYTISVDELAVFGSLTTDRVELPYKGGLLVFDHSFYLQCDDYEVEYETTDAINGAQIFDDFLQQHHIEKKVTAKKIARFMKALQQKG
ncbi:CYTH domain-containing protein [Lysinibacillus piscis]|uniref:Adenylate cyclase n=1 Tax=Lysinibacillus piscis TaxID=2518931 RepID=A0ABQ5NH95_9BACI|nr:CYTH domain-containing protein [Lysinibacillus sp. KH24]GLC87735.1 adenylate cyclase [Lysinibacillus sp. KH24]